MPQSLQVLFVEDNLDDVALIEMELQKSGIEPESHRVETGEALKKALDEHSWDIIISDYNLPGFDGLTALEKVREREEDIPFILVSGTVGEEFAVEAVLAGAQDYVMKDNLKRVPVAVRRELESKNLRAEKRRADEQVLESLKEKEVMLKEIHHRVKNNLAVISALLTLQSDFVEDEKSRRLFLESVGRIKSMALIHEKLYQSEMMASVDMDEYLRELVSSIRNTCDTDSSDIDVHISSDNFNMDITKAIPCGLIVNELLSNAYKHAFKSREKGNIHLSMKRSPETGKCSLNIRDDGVGVPEEVLSGSHNSLGYTIIKGLVRQIGGDIKVVRKNGTDVTLTFENR